jgi:arsenite methyltransferase
LKKYIERYKYINNLGDETMSDEKVNETTSNVQAGVRKHYGRMASEFSPNKAECGCSAGNTGAKNEREHASLIYQTSDIEMLPVDVTGLSAGCGDPVTLASLRPGETVLDLGCGGGIDCFLAAQRVGESGHVIGVDMTAEMIDQARSNKAKLNAANVEFRLGEIEHLPVADEIVDVIISNCVINLSPGKSEVFREAFRVLRGGGRLAVSDIVTDGPLPQEIRDSLAAWYGCIAGALDYREYIELLKDAGFVDVELSPIKIDVSQVESMVEPSASCCEADPKQGSDRKAYALVDAVLEPIDFGDARPPFSARITARKPS